MGVKGLWQILEPVKQHKPLADLRGQLIAVDLSIWIVEAKTCLHPSVKKPHLRNLFFRVSHLLRIGIIPVIVIEGIPPDLKQAVMKKRAAHRFPRPAGKTTTKIGRSHFQSVNRECCEMLEMLGVPFVQAAGEAEAMCAFLNRNHIVDGCITNDGDTFLYGARTVYRNFTMNIKDRHVDAYNMEDVEETLGLDREKLVGLAVLLGCDYLPKGVAGVGQQMALRLIAGLKNESLLERFYAWSQGSVSNGLGKGYPISLKDEKPGEFFIYQKAKASPGFPHKEVIDEFLVDKNKLPAQRKFVWKRPKLFPLAYYAFGRLEWPEEYTFNKVLPLVTLFDMDSVIRSGLVADGCLRPFRIVKRNTRSGVSCFEVEWHKLRGDELMKCDYYTTVEEQRFFQMAFPDIVAEFEMELNAKPVKRKQKAKKNLTTGDEFTEQQTDNLRKLSLKEDVCEARDLSDGTPPSTDRNSNRNLQRIIPIPSTLRKSKSMAEVNQNLHEKPSRFVISSDSSDDCEEVLPHFPVFSDFECGTKDRQKQEWNSSSESVSESLLPLFERLKLQHRNKTKNEAKVCETRSNHFVLDTVSCGNFNIETSILDDLDSICDTTSTLDPNSGHRLTDHLRSDQHEMNYSQLDMFDDSFSLNSPTTTSTQTSVANTNTTSANPTTSAKNEGLRETVLERSAHKPLADRLRTRLLGRAELEVLDNLTSMMQQSFSKPQNCEFNCSQ